MPSTKNAPTPKNFANSSPPTIKQFPQNLKSLQLSAKPSGKTTTLHASRSTQHSTEHIIAQPSGVDAPPNITEHATRSTIQDYQSAITTLSQQYSREQILLTEQASALKAEASQLEDEIRKLRTGDREISYESEAPNAVRLRRLLRAELGLSSEEVGFLCDQLNISDEAWQDALEGILGFNRFTLLVPPAHYDAAMKLYRERRHKDGLHGVALLDTDRILKNKTERATRNTLSSEVKTENPAARAFVDLLLGHYIKCDSLEELRSHRTAVTRERFVRRNYTASHLNPQAYKRWFIGERAAPRQIEQRETRIDEIANELK